MKAFRIELPSDGLGFFRQHGVYGDNFFIELVERHAQFPCPFMDHFPNYIFSLDSSRKDKFCAFKDIAQIEKWITKDELIKLNELGYRVYMLNLKTCHVGAYQILYEKIHILNKEDITKWLLNKQY